MRLRKERNVLIVDNKLKSMFYGEDLIDDIKIANNIKLKITFKLINYCNIIKKDELESKCVYITKIKESVPRVKLTHLSKTNIIDVWAHNFMAEITEIASLIEEFNVISLVINFMMLGYRISRNRVRLTRK